MNLFKQSTGSPRKKHQGQGQDFQAPISVLIICFLLETWIAEIVCEKEELPKELWLCIDKSDLTKIIIGKWFSNVKDPQQVQFDLISFRICKARSWKKGGYMHFAWVFPFRCIPNWSIIEGWKLKLAWEMISLEPNRQDFFQDLYQNGTI